MLYVILNPNAGRGRAAGREAAIRAALDAADLPFELVRTERPDHARELAASAAERGGYRAIVAAGGDGTINEVVNGLLGSSTPLGLIPLGTGNDFVKMFDLPPDRPHAAALRLRNGTIRAIDVGIANGRAFVNGVGCGIDGQVAVAVRRPLRFADRLPGVAIYLVALARALASYQSPPLRVCYGGKIVQGRMLLATIGNGRCVGGGFWVTPDARIDDGLLDLCLCSRLRPDQIVRYVLKVMRGTHSRLRFVRMARARTIEIETDSPIAAHVDGEILGAALRHIAVTIEPGALNLLI